MDVGHLKRWTERIRKHGKGRGEKHGEDVE
jgi:hypothetical protein